jgi:hypothetical protein
MRVCASAIGLFMPSAHEHVVGKGVLSGFRALLARGRSGSVGEGDEAEAGKKSPRTPGVDTPPLQKSSPLLRTHSTPIKKKQSVDSEQGSASTLDAVQEVVCLLLTLAALTEMPSKDHVTNRPSRVGCFFLRFCCLKSELCSAEYEWSGVVVFRHAGQTGSGQPG